MNRETISNVIENAEMTSKEELTDLKTSEAVEARRNSQPRFIGLGPPDLCVLTKTFEPASLIPTAISRKYESRNYFHWALGVNASSVASISSYFGELVAKQEKKYSMLGSWGNKFSGSFKINFLHYVTYNAFDKRDLNIMLVSNIDGDTYYLDDQGKREREISDTFWRQTHLCGMLRYLQYVQPFVADSTNPYWKSLKSLRPAILIKPQLFSAEEDQIFLSLAREFFWQGNSLGTSLNIQRIGNEESNENSKQQESSVHFGNNLLTTIIFDYLFQKRRYSAIQEFFSEFSPKYPALNAYVARALYAAGNTEEALRILTDSIEKSGDDSSQLELLLEAQVEILKGLRQYESAHSVAQKLSSRNSSSKFAVLFAEIQVHLGNYEKALELLNTVNSDELKIDGDSIGITKSAFQTDPLLPPLATFQEIEEQERNQLDSEKGYEKSLFILDGVNLTEKEQEIHRIVVSMVNILGWEKFLELKSRVFKTKRVRYLNSARNSVALSSSSNNTVNNNNNAITQANSNNNNTSVDNNNSDHKSEEEEEKETEISEKKSENKEEEDTTASTNSDEKPEKESSVSPSTEETNEVAVPIDDSVKPASLTTSETDVDDSVTNVAPNAEIQVTVHAEEVAASEPPKATTVKRVVNDNGIDMNIPMEHVFTALLHDMKAYLLYGQIKENPSEFKNYRAVDYVRLGLLCLRLDHDDEAEKIFEKCVGSHWHLRAWQELLKLYMTQKRYREILVVADHLFKHYEEQYPRSVGTYPLSTAALYKLVSDAGLTKVRSLLKTAFVASVSSGGGGQTTTLPLTNSSKGRKAGSVIARALSLEPSDEPHPRISSVLLDCVEWKTHRYNE